MTLKNKIKLTPSLPNKKIHNNLFLAKKLKTTTKKNIFSQIYKHDKEILLTKLWLMYLLDAIVLLK